MRVKINLLLKVLISRLQHLIQMALVTIIPLNNQTSVKKPNSQKSSIVMKKCILDLIKEQQNQVPLTKTISQLKSNLKVDQEKLERSAVNHTCSHNNNIKKNNDSVQNEVVKKEYLSLYMKPNVECMQSSCKGSTISSVIENLNIHYGTLV
ncbi:3966_t:CDS:2 [Acaulospora morrowiae]|uniref:3966_t:CDS:1 n=1 Tax=Acaulospora morrowiae TaxID=94023 RepID=A0A9N9CHK5_9GLOM|nr:3966_t:CDS:2 [Acaulospora morrowiae]